MSCEVSGLIEFPKISPVEQLFNVIPQWRLVEEHASPMKGENQVCCSFLCVCVVEGVCLVAGYFFEKLECMFAVFRKIKASKILGASQLFEKVYF